MTNLSSMMHNWGRTTALLLGIGVGLLSASSAQAELEHCGGVFIAADAQCEFRPTEECTESCTTEAVETTCAAQIYPDCESNCSASASATCESSCSEVCTTDCEQQIVSEEPEEEGPTCLELCEADCEDNRSDRCSGSERQGACNACQAHNCSDKCQEQCANADEEDEPVVVDAGADAGTGECSTVCASACSGSCTADANAQCQIDCQDETYLVCEEEQVETCQTECETTGGAIFCDGEFLNTVSVQDCADELADELDIHVNIDISADVDINFSTSDTLDECGGVLITGDAECEFRTTEECTESCTTESVEASCAAEIYSSCESSCTADASVSCETSCTEVCTTDCTAQVAAEEPPDCMELCQADCQETRGGRCANSERRGPCNACHAQTCNDRCEEQCDDVPEAEVEVVECVPVCSSACTGSCTAQANAQCQIDCQTEVYTTCEEKQIETCETDCKTTGGAIFCNGSFLNSENLEDCAEALASRLDIHVDVSANLDIDVDVTPDRDKPNSNNNDDNDDAIDDACSVSAVGSNSAGYAGLALFGLLLAGGVRRRTLKSSKLSK